ncbi:MAG TPA: glycerol-3-phosphate dehydrogenase/oxidase [Jatrophihabitans sp.]|jgi:glycerol-3-phosphate dehydrogenase
MTGSQLNAARRIRELGELSERRGAVDLLVVGGGVTGCGVALDAASRGLSVVLAEKHDLAFGTSRWSSKLVHGGLRYLASGAVGIAHESAVERGILMTRTAPYLVRALPQVVPLLPQLTPGRARLVRAGLAAGDALRAAAGTPAAVLPRSRRIDTARVADLVPGVRSDGLRGGLLGYDGQLADDVRLTVTIARTAAAYGARILTRCAAEQVTGRGAVLRDTLTGASCDLDARMVVNAAGVWAGEFAPGVTLRPSRGAHLVVAQERLGGLAAGLTVPVPGTVNRFVFALPAPDRRVYIGLTDEEAPGPIPDVPIATDAEIDFLLDTINGALRDPLERTDLLGSFAGLRPLLDTGTAGTADISRRHAVLTAADGLVTVVGGKLTTYRRMAQDAVDAALRASGAPARPCLTAQLPLVGTGSAAATAPARLVHRYGTDAGAVVGAAQGDPALLEPVADGVDTIAAELRFGVTHELALDAADLLERRTRLALDPRAAAAAAPAAAAALAGGAG